MYVEVNGSEFVFFVSFCKVFSMQYNSNILTKKLIIFRFFDTNFDQFCKVKPPLMKTIFYSLLVIKFENASLSPLVLRGEAYEVQLVFLNFNLKKYLDLHIWHVSIIYFAHKGKLTYQGDVWRIPNFEIILLLNISIK